MLKKRKLILFFRTSQKGGVSGSVCIGGNCGSGGFAGIAAASSEQKGGGQHKSRQKQGYYALFHLFVPFLK